MVPLRQFDKRFLHRFSYLWKLTRIKRQMYIKLTELNKLLYENLLKGTFSEILSEKRVKTCRTQLTWYEPITVRNNRCLKLANGMKRIILHSLKINYIKYASPPTITYLWNMNNCLFQWRQFINVAPILNLEGKVPGCTSATF